MSLTISRRRTEHGLLMQTPRQQDNELAQRIRSHDTTAPLPRVPSNGVNSNLALE